MKLYKIMKILLQSYLMNVYHSFLIAMCLIAPSLSLFVWHKDLLVSETLLQPETKLLCQLFSEEKGVYNISQVTHQDDALNLTFSVPIPQNKAKIVSIIFPFPQKNIQKDLPTSPIEYRINKASFTLHERVDESKTGFEVARSTPIYSIKYIPSANLDIESYEMSLSFKLKEVKIEYFLWDEFKLEYFSFLVSFFLVIQLHGHLKKQRPKRSQISCFTGYFLLLPVVLKSKILQLVSLGHISQFPFTFTIFLLEVFFFSFLVTMCLMKTQFPAKQSLKDIILINYCFSIILLFWFNTWTAILFLLVSLLTIRQIKLKNRDPFESSTSRQKTVFIILMIVYMFGLKSADDLNPGIFPYSFEKIEFNTQPISGGMLVFIILVGLVSIDSVFQYFFSCLKSFRKSTRIKIESWKSSKSYSAVVHLERQ